MWYWLAGVLALFGGLAVYGFLRKRYHWTDLDTRLSQIRSLKEPYWRRVLVAFDVFCNVIFGGLPDETISARCGRWAHTAHGGPLVYRWFARFVTAWLNAIQVDHGEQAMSGDLARAQVIVALESAALAEPSFSKDGPNVPH